MWFLVAGLLVAVGLAARFGLRRIQYLNPKEQLLVKLLTSKIVVNGPAVYFPPLFETLSYKKRPALTLATAQHCVVTEERTGEQRVVEGPCALFLGPYEAAAAATESRSLSEAEGVVVLDRASGTRELLAGPLVYAPRTAYEVVERHVAATTLKASEYVRVQDARTGKVRVVAGECRFFLEPHEALVGKIANAWTLGANDYVRLRDGASGSVRVVRGPGVCVPKATEDAVDGPEPLAAVALKAWEYSVIQAPDGARRVERGPALIRLGPEDVFLSARKTGATVDALHAALVRDRSTGAERLVTCEHDASFVFVPAAGEEIVEVRDLVRLAEHEAVILRDGSGNYHYRYGKTPDGCFFVPPTWEIVSLKWSRGRRRETRDLVISVFDCRPQYMSFEFNCRTSDNVELVLEGTFFWEVASIPKMLEFTSDAPGDVCSHARSSFIALISKVTLAEFMASFNDLAKRASDGDDAFYRNRGIDVHSLEVTRYACADASTSAILAQIISETTNRMCRLSQQDSENEIALSKIDGAVAQEKGKAELNEIREARDVAAARAEGEAEAQRLLSFLETLDGRVTDGEALWRELRRKDALEAVASGSAHVYFTPDQAQLTIETRA
ncbi:hypothetical protein SO694_00018251 [Aureococcus anophagefferens]|uniref:Band 7 domain-containing protein n=1 Tax=Aureococcus anophagefferens TaxID=44056 RepID=A0ABR1G0R1_AURAN